MLSSTLEGAISTTNLAPRWNGISQDPGDPTACLGQMVPAKPIRIRTDLAKGIQSGNLGWITFRSLPRPDSVRARSTRTINLRSRCYVKYWRVETTNCKLWHLISLFSIIFIDFLEFLLLCNLLIFHGPFFCLLNFVFLWTCYISPNLMALLVFQPFYFGSNFFFCGRNANLLN